jgi:hypothetical protein
MPASSEFKKFEKSAPGASERPRRFSMPATNAPSRAVGRKTAKAVGARARIGSMPASTGYLTPSPGI